MRDFSIFPWYISGFIGAFTLKAQRRLIHTSQYRASYEEIATIKKENMHLKERYMIGDIKTAAGIDREIPICEKIYPVVEKDYNAGSKKILEIHEKVFYNNFYVTLERLSIRKLNPHCCRHTFATLMAKKGVQPAVITETAGHEDYSTTMQYTHIHLKEKLKAVNRL